MLKSVTLKKLWLQFTSDLNEAFIVPLKWTYVLAKQFEEKQAQKQVSMGEWLSEYESGKVAKKPSSK